MQKTRNIDCYSKNQLNLSTQMSEHPQEQPVETQPETQIHDQPNLTIDTIITEPTSPERFSKQNGSVINSSPKAGNSQRVLSQQSPIVLKNKLDTLKNLYKKHQDQYNQIIETEKSLESKKQDLKIDLTNSLRQQSQKMNEKQNIAELQQRLQNLRSQNITALYAERINELKSQIVNAQQILFYQEDALKTSGEEFLNSKIQQKLNQFTQNLALSQKRKQEAENAIFQTKQKIDHAKSTISTLKLKLSSIAGGNNSIKLNQLQEQKRNLEKHIESQRQQIYKLRDELDSTSKAEATFEVVTLPELTPLKSEVEEIKKKKAQIEKQLESAQKQSKEVASKIKSTEIMIQKIKSKNNQINDKTKKLEEEKSQLEKDIASNNKKPKYEEKVPEQLIQLRNKKAALQKQAKQEALKGQNEKNKADALVPSSIIEKMQLKIKAVHERDQLWHKLVTQNTSLAEQNKKLDAKKEELQWEKNPEVTNADITKQKEEGKCHAVEEEVAVLRKKNNQLVTKVEEYEKEYPDFKIEKKLKKLEPVPQSSPTKAPAIVPENKNSNIKKKNKSNEQIPVSLVQEEEEKPAPVVQKTANKKEDQKGGKNKNNSPKPKQQELQVSKKEEASKNNQKKEQTIKKDQKKEEAPRKTEPAKKQEAPKKIQAPKKQQASKKQQVEKKTEKKKEPAKRPEQSSSQAELKIESKPSMEEKGQQQGGHQAKNKNKKK